LIKHYLSLYEPEGSAIVGRQQVQRLQRSMLINPIKTVANLTGHEIFDSQKGALCVNTATAQADRGFVKVA
jgi:hypothetical protein